MPPDAESLLRQTKKPAVNGRLFGEKMAVGDVLGFAIPVNHQTVGAGGLRFTLAN